MKVLMREQNYRGPIHGASKYYDKWSDDEKSAYSSAVDEYDKLGATANDLRDKAYQAARKAGLIGGFYSGQGLRGYGVGDEEIEQKSLEATRAALAKRDELADMERRYNDAAQRRGTAAYLAKKGLPNSDADIDTYYNQRDIKNKLNRRKRELAELMERVDYLRAEIEELSNALN